MSDSWLVKRLKDLAPAVIREHREQIYLARYWLKDSLTVQHRLGSVKFDTSSRLAKTWFYPRYADGSLHEPAISNFLLDTLEPGDTFYDVGSHLGYYALLAASAYNSIAAHAFELNPLLTPIIQSHIYKNGIGDMIKIVSGAVSNTNTVVAFTPTTRENPSTNHVTADGNLNVPTVVLDEYASSVGEPPAVLKIDVEGHEGAVLDGMTSLVKNEKLRTILLEVHPHSPLLDDSDISRIIDRLQDARFNIQIFSEGGRESGDRTLTPLPPAPVKQNKMLICERE